MSSIISMRVQVEVSATVKTAAEAQAKSLGYPSLATMLRVLTAGLAREYQAAHKPATASREFKHWPAHIRRDLANVDPHLYRFYIENGIIN